MLKMKRFLRRVVVVTAVLCMVGARAADPVEGLVEVLGVAQEVQLQLDILRGMTDALKGKRDVSMPAGWEKVEQRLGASENPQVKLLTQSLGLTFGSQRALGQLREVVKDRNGDANTRRSALESLLTARVTLNKTRPFPSGNACLMALVASSLTSRPNGTARTGSINSASASASIVMSDLPSTWLARTGSTRG